MKLDQFDKLHDLLKELEEKTRLFKQENYKLKIENKKLQDKISLLELNSNSQGLSKVTEIKKENESLKIKNNEAKARLAHLISQVEGNIAFEKGVG
ncbi:MAG: hypothetical protein D8M58_02110 [Calditrichaeota bacterium]|nr:MAG: hypothetical protein DWQ03_04970 [Calditrichota bacterium]MBL1204160.1 hypothetical protein [Calditrichota bacterium]NOG43991.1 hypothetical protein [Calditrichota bacterium]